MATDQLRFPLPNVSLGWVKLKKTKWHSTEGRAWLLASLTFPPLCGLCLSWVVSGYLEYILGRWFLMEKISYRQVNKAFLTYDPWEKPALPEDWVAGVIAPVLLVKNQATLERWTGSVSG